MSKDPMWIPKPPVLYGSNKLEIFQPYDPETPVHFSLPGSPSCPGSPSDSSSSGSITLPSLLTSKKAIPPVSSIATTPSTSNRSPGKNSTSESSNKNPLQTILKSLFGGKQSGCKQSDSVDSTDESLPKTTIGAKKTPALSQVSGSIVDPIVQQYGQKSKVKEIEEDKDKENDFDRPYDPEEEYDPAMRNKMFPTQTIEKIKFEPSETSHEDDVAYDPEDDTIFEEFQSDVPLTKLAVPTQNLDSPACPTPVSCSTPAQSSNPVSLKPNLTGTIVVSAATLSEQQRMLEELNKQIEEQKRQLKEQEEALRQQREAVGMFMAHFSVSDSLISPPTKALPLSQLSPVQGAVMQTESKPSNQIDMPSSLTETENSSAVKSETVKLEETTDGQTLKDNKNTVAGEAGIHNKECDKESSAGEIEDSDVAYDPEDESLFDEIQEDVFKGGIAVTSNSFSRGVQSPDRDASPNSPHPKKRRSSPKRRSRHEKDHRRSPSRRSQQRSRSRSRRRRDKDKYKRSERDRSRHRTRDSPERSGHYRKDRTTRRHSRGRRRSPSPPRKKHSVSLSPKRRKGPVSRVIEKTKHGSVPWDARDSVSEKFVTVSPITVKKDPDGLKLESNLVENPKEHILEFVHKVKTEISESPDGQKFKMEKKSFSHNDISVTGNASQEKKATPLETFSHDKYESTIPLRELDPPIRDSPESPDPEPQFVKPFTREKNDSAKTEENGDTAEDNSASMPLFKKESNYAPIGGLVIQGAGLETGTLAKVSSSDTRFQENSFSKPTMHDSEHRELEKTEIRLPWPRPGILNRTKEKCVMQQETCLQSSLSDMPEETGIQHQNINRTDSRTVMRNQTLDLSLKDENQNINNPCSDLIQNLRPSILNPSMAESNKSQLSDVSDNEVLGSRNFLSALLHTTDPRGHGDEADQSVSPLENLLCLKTIVRSQSESADGRSGKITSFEKTDFQPRRGDANLCLMGHGQNSENMANMTNPNWRGPGSLQINQNKSLGSLEGNLDQNVPRLDAWKALVQRGLDPVSAEPCVENDWSGHQAERKGPIANQEPEKESVRNLKYREPESGVGPKIHNLRHDDTEPARSDFMGAGRETKVPQMPFLRHDRTKLVGSNFTEQRSDKRNPSNIGSSGMRTSGSPDFMGPRLDGQKLPVEGPEPNRREPHFQHFEGSGQKRNELTMNRHGSDKGGSTDPNFRGPWLERRRPNMAELDTKTERMGFEGPDFREVIPESRGLSMDGAEHYRTGPRDQEFRRSGHDERRITMEDPGSQNRGCEGPVFRGPGPESRCVSMENPEPERRNPRGPDFRRPVNKMRGPFIDSQDSDRRGPRGPDIWRPRDHSIQVRPHSREDETEGGYPNLENSGHNWKDPDFRAPHSDMAGPPLNQRGLGGPRMGRPGPQHEFLNTTNLRPDDRCLEAPNIRESCQEGLSSGINNTTNSKSFPCGSQFKHPVSVRTPPDMESLQSNRGSPNFKGMGPNRTFMEGPRPIRKGPGDFRGPDNESRGSDVEGPVVDRQNIGGSSFRESLPERPHPKMEGSGPNWEETGELKCRDKRIRQQAEAEDFRYKKQNDWGESEPISEIPDLAFPGSDRTFRNFNPSRPMRGNIRGRRPRVRGFTHGRSDGDFEGQWLDRRKPIREALDDERECSEDSWDNSSNVSSAPVEDVLDEQGHIWPDHSNKWRDTHEGQSMHVPGPVQGRKDDRNGPGCRGQEPVQENSDMVCPEFGRRGQRHEWREPNRESSGPFFRDEGGPGNRGQICDRGRGRGRGPRPGLGMQKHLYMGNDRMQHNFRGNIRDPNLDIPRAHRRGSDLMNPCPNRRAFEMEEQGSSDVECPESGYRNSNNENLGFDEENSDFGELRSGRYDEDMEDPRTGFEQNFRGERGAPKMRRQRPSTGPSKADMRRWYSNTEFTESDRRGPNMRERDREQGHLDQTSSMERRGPRQVSESHGPCEKPAPFSRSLGLGPNRGEKTFPGFDNTQNQQTAQPPRHRGALLPTPKDCPLPPNQMIRNHDAFNPTMKESSRGRAADYRFRGRARGLRRGTPGRFRAMGREDTMEEGN